MEFFVVIYSLAILMGCVMIALSVFGIAKLGQLFTIPSPAYTVFRWVVSIAGIITAILLIIRMEDKLSAALSVLILSIALFVFLSYNGSK